MKKSFLLFVVISTAVLFTDSSAQNKSFSSIKEAKIKTAEETLQSNRPILIDPQPLLAEHFKKIGFDPASVKFESAALRKTTAWNFNVGDQKTWKAYNYKTSGYDDVASTCKAVGTNCYIFVQNTIWDEPVTQTSVDRVKEAFDSKTPAGSVNPNQGIYQNDVDIFGTPPDKDNDPKIIILILDIQDSYSGPGSGYIAGFFSSLNESLTDSRSNKGEFYYLDGKQTDLSTDSGIELAAATTAHEFQHMIHYAHINPATTFFNECFSLTAEIINGYPVYSQYLYVGESNRYLLDWRSSTDQNVLKDYSRASRFGLYLKEQFGNQFFTKYMQLGIDGVAGVNASLIALGSSRTFNSILPDWFTANYLLNYNSVLGYTTPGIIQMEDTKIFDPNTTGTSYVYNYGVQYITFTQGKNLSVAFDNLGYSGIKIKVFKHNGSGGYSAIEDLSPNVDYYVPDFGTGTPQVTFMIYMDDNVTNPNFSKSFTYSASGTFVNAPQEIAYDTTEPSSVYLLSVGDTCGVYFDGITGTKLDSIRVALRNTATMEGGIWRIGTQSFTAGRLSQKFFLAGKTTPAYDQSAQSYPIPFPNWITKDLRSENIDAANDFMVNFVINGVYENSSSPYNRVMHTDIAGNSAFHSFTYLNNPGTGFEPTWYFLGNTGKGTISLYLIRAYVSYKTSTGVEEPLELLPSVYSLDQNYPNPFNPSTIISYNLPKAGNVQIKIFDALGREVRSLIDEYKNAGKYNILWDSRDNSGYRVSSGIYFYTITSGDFVQTKKMVLLR